MKRLSSWRGDGRVLGTTQDKVVFLKPIVLRRPANQWIKFYLSGGQESVHRQHYRHVVIHYHEFFCYLLNIECIFSVEFGGPSHETLPVDGKVIINHFACNCTQNLKTA